MTTAAQMESATRNRLRSRLANSDVPEVTWLRDLLPEDFAEELYALGLDRGTAAMHVAFVDRTFELELTGYVDGRPIRATATATDGDTLWPNLLRAFA